MNFEEEILVICLYAATRYPLSNQHNKYVFLGMALQE